MNFSFPPAHRLSWIVGAWDAVGDGQLRLNIDRAKPWNDPVNYPPTATSLLDKPPRTFEIMYPACPENPDIIEGHVARRLDFVGCGGLGLDGPTLPRHDPRAGFFAYDQPTKRADITDGAANTMAVIETARDNGPWTAGGWASVRGLDPQKTPYIGAGRQFGGYHRGGSNVLFADGSVRFVKETVDPKVFEALSTITGARTNGGLY